MNVLLKGGPLDGTREKVPVEARQFSTRVNGKRVVYQETTETDSATGMTIFAYRPSE